MSDQQTQQPTPQDVAQVSQATAEAAAAAPTPEQARTDAAAAARTAADKVKLELTDEQIAQIANGTVAALEARGAFEPPMEPVAPPPAPPVDPADPGSTPAPVAAAPAPAAAPRKRTFAQKFLGE